MTKCNAELCFIDGGSAHCTMGVGHEGSHRVVNEDGITRRRWDSKPQLVEKITALCREIELSVVPRLASLDESQLRAVLAGMSKTTGSIPSLWEEIERVS